MPSPLFSEKLQRQFLGLRLGLLLGVSALFAVILHLSPGALPQPLSLLERYQDHLLLVHAKPEAGPQVVLIDIDESSLAQLGRWPWARSRMADLLDALLLDYGVAHVGLDVVFPEPADAEGDDRLHAWAKAGKVTLAQVFQMDAGDGLRVGQLQGGAPIAGPSFPAATGFIGNHAGLSGAGCVGHISPLLDQDGMARRVPLMIRYQDRNYPALAMAMLGCWLDGAGEAAWQKSGYGWRMRPINVSPGIWQTDADGLYRLPYQHGVSSWIAVPAADVLSGRVPADMLHGRLVLVGSTALGVGDFVATPHGARTPGLMLHAEMLLQALGELERPSPPPVPVWALVMLWSLVVMLTLGLWWLNRPFQAHVLLLLGLVALIAALEAGALRADIRWLALLSSGTVLLLLAVLLDWYVSQRYARQLYALFRDYLPKELIRQLVDRNDPSVLRAQERTITALFVDIHGFTTMAEVLRTDELVATTRKVLGELTHSVLQSNGTLDKYMGDALFAYWGAPLDCPSHADQALDAARDMLRRIHDYNREHPERPISIRIGIQSGLAIVGDLGTDFRRSYTAIGDVVNVAQRLEKLAAEYPGGVLIGAGAQERLTRHACSYCADVKLKGRQGHMAVYIPDFAIYRAYS